MRRLLLILFLSTLAGAAGYLPDRRQLLPAVRPYTALTRINAGGGLGCGVLVGPDLMLTCSHCLADPARKIYPEVEVEMGLGFFSKTHKAKVTDAVMSTGDNDVDSGTDWALARLDRPLGFYYGWLKCKPMTSLELHKASVELMGYCGCPDEARREFGAMDKPYRCPGEIRDVNSRLLFHDCSMWGGTSGAPLVMAAGDSYEVVALNFAGVDVENEKMPHGFRSEYIKKHANLAIPSASWQPALEQMTVDARPGLRTLWVRNRSVNPIRVVARYASIFDAPGEPLKETKEVEIPWQKRVCVLTSEEGCAESEVYLMVTDRKGNRVGPDAPIEVEKDGVKRAFFKKSLGRSTDYTTVLP